MIFTPHQILFKKNRMGGAPSTYGERVGAYRFLVGNLRERYHLEDPGVDGRIILRWIFRNWGVGAWSGLIWPQNRDGWWALVNAAMNIRFP